MVGARVVRDTYSDMEAHWRTHVNDADYKIVRKFTAVYKSHRIKIIIGDSYDNPPSERRHHWSLKIFSFNKSIEVLNLSGYGEGRLKIYFDLYNKALKWVNVTSNYASEVSEILDKK